MRPKDNDRDVLRGTNIFEADNALGSKEKVVQLKVFHRLRFLLHTPFIGSAVSLPCTARGDLRPAITWEKDKPPLPLDSKVVLNGTLVFQNIQKSHQGSYTCTATNALGTISDKVTVNSPVAAASCAVVRKNAS